MIRPDERTDVIKILSNVGWKGEVQFRDGILAIIKSRDGSKERVFTSIEDVKQWVGEGR